MRSFRPKQLRRQSLVVMRFIVVQDHSKVGRIYHCEGDDDADEGQAQVTGPSRPGSSSRPGSELRLHRYLLASSASSLGWSFEITCYSTAGGSPPRPTDRHLARRQGQRPASQVSTEGQHGVNSPSQQQQEIQRVEFRSTTKYIVNITTFELPRVFF